MGATRVTLTVGTKTTVAVGPFVGCAGSVTVGGDIVGNGVDAAEDGVGVGSAAVVALALIAEAAVAVAGATGSGVCDAAGVCAIVVAASVVPVTVADGVTMGVAVMDGDSERSVGVPLGEGVATGMVAVATTRVGAGGARVAGGVRVEVGVAAGGEVVVGVFAAVLVGVARFVAASRGVEVAAAVTLAVGLVTEGVALVMACGSVEVLNW